MRVTCWVQDHRVLFLRAATENVNELAFHVALGIREDHLREYAAQFCEIVVE